jgi:periplasmic divalent cation tolerance protein
MANIKGDKRVFNDMTEYVLAITTCPENEANSIAYSLVEDKLCACANIISGITSIYSWKGKIETSTECLVLMKTERNLTDRLYNTLLEIHSYEVPEFVVISIDDGSKEYLSWISECVD